MLEKNTILEIINDKNYFPMKFLDFKEKLKLSEDDTKNLGKILDELVYEGYVSKEKNGVYTSLSVNSNLLTGTFCLMSKGYGFLRVDDDRENDVFIPPDKRNFAANNDRVLVKITGNKMNMSREGEIVQVLERVNKTIVGKLQVTKRTVFLVPFDKKIGFDIYIKNKNRRLRDGEIVVAKITKWPDKFKGAAGEIVDVLGYFESPGVDVMSIIRSRGIRVDFPKSVINEADSVSKMNISFNGRKDYTEKLIITIDGDSAKDLDDAVSLEILDNGNFLLGVHIADVSEYVKENSYLDKEALKRGTSIYFADRVVPMLPEKISNGCCSLNPNENKYALSVDMEIDKKGIVVSYSINKSVIKSSYRMTYNNVTEILNGNAELKSQYSDIVEMLANMKILAEILNKKRAERGSIDFDFPESEFEFDENGKVSNVYPRKYTIANRIIEEFMLICNETVAEHTFWGDIPSVYRIHECPSDEKMSEFKKIILPLGYNIKNNKILYPGMFSDFLRDIKGKPEEKALSTMLLRTFMKAKYSPINDGHFGLSAKYYCHFTSPIRRYPDLAVHRILKYTLEGKSFDVDQLSAFVEKTAIKSSEKEIEAQDAERAVDDIKKAEFMRDYIGDEFNGVISSVTSFGIFVELENTVEGLIRYKDIKNDYFNFDSSTLTATNSAGNIKYKIGDRVKVKVIGSMPETGEIDFILI